MFSSILLCRVSNRCLDISVCSVGKLRSHSTASAALLPSDLGWSANLDVSPLRPGEVLHAMRCEQLPCEVSKCVEVCRSVSKCVEVCRSVKAKSTASVLTEMDLDRCMKALQIRADLDLDRGD